MDWNDIEILNPWWTNPASIDDDPYLKAIEGKPYYFDNPVKSDLKFEGGHTYVLRGARQVGKTTLMKEIISKAIRTKYAHSERCIFMSCEAVSDYTQLQKLLTSWLQDKKEDTCLICLDEITFIEEWQRSILWLINSGLLKNSTVLISGSNARDLKKMSERFPGRNVKEIRIHPLSIKDYQKINFFKKINHPDLLEIYMHVGGFPHAIKDYYEYKTVSDDTFETYANWIFGDAHRFGLSREILLHILFRIYETSASRITYQRLVEKSPVKSHETAASYIEHVEEAFLCKILNCYDIDKEIAAPRKAKKIYYIDPLLYQLAGGFLKGIRNTSDWWKKELQNNILRGNLFESLVVNQFSREIEDIYYWYSSNTKKEVDILLRKGKEISLFEVKTQPEILGKILGKEVQLITPEYFLERIL